MKAELEAVGKIIAAEKIETPHLNVAKSLFQQLQVRWNHHQTMAQRLADEQAAKKAAEVEAAAKIVQQAEQDKANAAAQLASQEQQAAAVPTAE